MANYTTTKTASYAKKAGYGAYRGEIADFVTITVSTTVIGTINNTIELLWVPKNAVITGITFACSDIDTNGTPTVKFDIGDSGSANRYLAASTIGQSAGITNAIAQGGFLYKTTADTKIIATVNTAPATAAAGTITFGVTYVLDENYATLVAA